MAPILSQEIIVVFLTYTGTAANGASKSKGSVGMSLTALWKLQLKWGSRKLTISTVVIMLAWGIST